MSDRIFNRTTPPHILTLVIATATTSLTMNIFLPSLPGMARHFNTDYAVMQLAVSLYLFAAAILQIFFGPASDRFGRRPVMLACFVVFLAGTIGAILAPDVNTLLGCRLLQAFSAAGMVLSRAIVRDTVGPAAAASKIGYITMGMALAPMIAPFVGGVLDEIYGWQATFFVTLAFGVVSLSFIYFDLGETNHNPSSSFAAQFRSYPALLGSGQFWGYAVTLAFTSGAFFAFVGGGPYIATEVLGLSPSGYGMYFALVSAGYICGNFATGRFTTRVGINWMMLIGSILAMIGITLAAALFYAGLNHPLSLFGPAILVGLGNGLTLPNANAGLISVRPDLAGTASGLGGALQMGGGGLLSIAGGAFLTPLSGPYPLLAVMFLSSIVALVANIGLLRLPRP